MQEAIAAYEAGDFAAATTAFQRATVAHAAAAAAGGAAAAGAGSGAVERSEHEKKFDRQIR